MTMENRLLDFTRTAQYDVEELLTPTLLRKMTNAKNETQFFNAVYLSLLRTKKLPSYNKDTFIRPTTKTVEWSRYLRLEGNKEYPHNLEGALIYYSRAIAAAPYARAEDNCSKELALAYGNRSAVYFRMNKLSNTLLDIKRALFCRFPDNLRYKLMNRRTVCLRYLNLIEAALKSCKQTIDVVNDMDEQPPNQKALLGWELEKLYTLKNEFTPDHLSNTFVPEANFYGYRTEMPDSLNCLDVIYKSNDTFRMICKQDVNPGDVLTTQYPYEAVLFPDHHFTHCYMCFNASDGMVPCPNCSQVMYCSLKCRQMAWDVFHQFQCPVLSIVNEYRDHLPSLALKMLLSTVHQCADGSLRQLHAVVDDLERQGKRFAKKRVFRMRGEPPSKTSRDPTKLEDFGIIYFLNRTHAAFGESLYPLRLDGTADPGDVSVRDLFLYALNAALIVNCLNGHTNFFRDPADHGLSSLKKEVFVGSLLMRFMQIVHHHGRAIDEKTYDKATDRFTVSQTGVGLYHSLSFLRHSCCNNASLVYFGGTLAFIYANQPINENQEVFFNVGCEMNYVQTNLTDRTCFLRLLNIVCKCEACRNDWPTVSQLNSRPHLPLRSTCFYCEAPQKIVECGVRVYCPNCGSTKDTSRTLEVFSEDLKTKFEFLMMLVHEGEYKNAKEILLQEVSQSLKVMFELYEMPNIFVLLYQHLLDEHYMKWSISKGKMPGRPAV